MTHPHLPETLPIQQLDANAFVEILGEANRELSRYDGMVQTLINPDILLSPFMTQEAVLSSKIEGTQATIDEVYEQDAGVTFNESKNEDINEIKNYREAMRFASKDLQDRPITLRLIKEIHYKLMDNVRGQNKQPGCFRDIQNWIGSKGSALDSATYIPPDPLQVQSLMENWLAYLQINQIDPLVQTAIMHAQFEIIHPFLDGNGRIGRLMIPLFLFSKKLLHRPMFYLSSYLENNRDNYYDKLNSIHKHNQWNEWISFFLEAIYQQAQENIRRAKAINRLFSLLQDNFRQITHSEYSQMLLESIFESPIFTKPLIIKKMQQKEESIQTSTIRNLLNQITNSELITLSKKGSGRKPDLFQLHDLLLIASGETTSLFSY